MFALEFQRSICLMMQVSGVSEAKRTDWPQLREEVVISGTAKLNIGSISGDVCLTKGPYYRIC